MSRATTSDRAYMGRVAALGCMLCRFLRLAEDTPAIVHHLRTGQGRMRAAHTDTMPLCPFHHQGSGQGVHDMGRSQFAALYGTSVEEISDELVIPESIRRPNGRPNGRNRK